MNKYLDPLVILFVAFPLVHANSLTTVVEEDDKVILLKPKSYLTNSSDIQQRWNLSSSPCSWSEISCSHRGFVTGVTLESQGLTAIPPIICKLRNLSLLRLTDNLLKGAFPTALYNCSKLEVLDMSNNQVHGPLPADIPRMSRLTSLDLSGNYLSGVFPTALYDCSKLEVLNLSNNQFHGPLPTDIHQMSRLTDLTLGG